ncbi:hypothetical protein AB4084_17685, partial [Lysobacter sp. 2RAB21]
MGRVRAFDSRRITRLPRENGGKCSGEEKLSRNIGVAVCFRFSRFEFVDGLDKRARPHSPDAGARGDSIPVSSRRPRRDRRERVMHRSSKSSRSIAVRVFVAANRAREKFRRAAAHAAGRMRLSWPRRP